MITLYNFELIFFSLTWDLMYIFEPVDFIVTGNLTISRQVHGDSYTKTLQLNFTSTISGKNYL